MASNETGSNTLFGEGAGASISTAANILSSDSMRVLELPLTAVKTLSLVSQPERQFNWRWEHVCRICSWQVQH